jgi:hypothetical protein
MDDNFSGDLPFPNEKIDVKTVNATFSRHRKNYPANDKTIKKSGVIWILWSSFWPTFVIGTLLKLANDVLLYITPLVSFLVL